MKSKNFSIPHCIYNRNKKSIFPATNPRFAGGFMVNGFDQYAYVLQ